MTSPDEQTPNQAPQETPAPEADAGAAQPSDTDAESRLDVAKRFLEEASVKDAPREKKIEFLRSKGIADDEIQSLLGKEPGQESTPTPEVRLLPVPTSSCSTNTRRHRRRNPNSLTRKKTRQRPSSLSPKNIRQRPTAPR